MKYLVISRTEDEPYVNFLTKSELEETLNTSYKEGYEFITKPPFIDLEEFPSMSIFIMKGEVVIPKAVERLKID